MFSRDRSPTPPKPPDCLDASVPEDGKSRMRQEALGAGFGSGRVGSWISTFLYFPSLVFCLVTQESGRVSPIYS